MTDVTDGTDTTDVTTGARRRTRSGTIIVIVLALLALLMAVGYAASSRPRCALNVADRPEFQTATVEGETRWHWWPPGFVTACKAFDAEGNEIPYVPAED